MLDIKEAYNLAKGRYDLPKLLQCLEFDSFYLFSFAPLLLNESNGYFTGTEFDAIDKDTGKHFYYDISSDIDAFERAKPIKIKTFIDEEI